LHRQAWNTVRRFLPPGIPPAAPACRTGQSRFLTTDNVARFIRTGSLFLGREMAQNEVTLVDL
ncbi:hypothetical protein V6C16_10985, partial [Desulfovibrio sp. 1188_IL3213]